MKKNTHTQRPPFLDAVVKDPSFLGLKIPSEVRWERLASIDLNKARKGFTLPCRFCVLSVVSGDEKLPTLSGLPLPNDVTWVTLRPFTLADGRKSRRFYAGQCPYCLTGWWAEKS